MRLSTTRALFLGGIVGLTLSVLPSCGKPTTITRCSASNCDGCCDSMDVCQKGSANPEQCGSGGASCGICAAGQTCARVDQNSEFGGRCVGGSGNDGGTGGGGGSTGGGSGGGGGSTGGGGGSTGGGSGSDGGTCNATTCANGCCSATGVCITNTTPSRCGTGGATCSSCTMGNTCVSGACTPCAGCINITTGACETGTANGACGKNGGFCQACDMQAAQTCQGGTCFGGSTCNSSTCAGCCDGNTCKLPTQWTNAQCGQGAPGAACVGCGGGSSCDAMDAGMCVGGGGTGGGGGFPGLDGGGFGSFCDSTTPCPSGQCCDSTLGVLGLCVSVGDPCGNLDPNNFVCVLASLGGGSCTCKSSGTCAP
ncbi:MAG: hypothetical protein ACOZQL_04685 [Myxococcota bacterium]